MAQSVLKYFTQNKIPLGWQPYQVVCVDQHSVCQPFWYHLPPRLPKLNLKPDHILGTCWWDQCLESYYWSAWSVVFTERVSCAAKTERSVKNSSLLKLFGCKWIYTVSFTVQSMELTVYLVCMYCWSSVLKLWHDDYAVSMWLMCFWHVVASGSFDCPNICSTSLAWVAVYAMVSGLGILD